MSIETIEATDDQLVPDKEKLRALAATLAKIEMPTLSSLPARCHLIFFQGKLTLLVEYLGKCADEL